jgi:GT2 family glycosyltransferase
MLDASLIIPTFNRRETLERTLARVLHIDHPRERWEAIVVDDGSIDDTERWLRRWAAKTPIQARCLRQRNSGPAAARNRGAAHARGENLLFIDNDVAVPPDFVRRHCETLRENPGACVVGRVVHPERLRKTAFGRYRDRLWERFHEAHAGAGLTETTGVTGQNFAIAAAEFRRLGGFDESFTIASGEDWELGYRARRAGLKVLYHPGIVVVHDDWAVSLETFCERQRLYSISDVLLWRKYGDRSPRRLVFLENAPIDWHRDRPSRIAKKALKRALATPPGRAAVRVGCALAERCFGDGALTRRAYDTAVSVAMFRGVREGIERYPEEGDPTRARALGPASPRPPLST